jgi:hypothetical protein
LVQTNGWQRSFQPSMNRPIAVISSLTLLKLPRRMAAGDDREEDLDHVQPRSAGRGEVQGDAWVARQPGPHGGMLWVA